MPTPAQSLYSLLKYWRSSGLTHLDVPESDLEARLSPEELMEQRTQALKELGQECSACMACGLGSGKRASSIGRGATNSRILFVSGPPEDEERGDGIFEREAAELFDRMLDKLGLAREAVYITSITKCHTPEGRAPLEAEVSPCVERFLLRQIDIIRPLAVCTLGSVATTSLLETDQPITRMRGRSIAWNNLRVFPTFHPTYLLRKKSARKDVWKDMLSLLDHIGLKTPER